MPTLKTYNLFISHAWKRNDDEYYRLTGMLNRASNFKWKNYSVPEHSPADANNDAALTKKLENQIRPTHCVLVLSGMYVIHRKWIQKEIQIAQYMNKPIIGIRPQGRQRIPEKVKGSAIVMVGWKTPSIVGAIRAYSL